MTRWCFKQNCFVSKAAMLSCTSIIIFSCHQLLSQTALVTFRAVWFGGHLRGIMARLWEASQHQCSQLSNSRWRKRQAPNWKKTPLCFQPFFHTCSNTTRMFIIMNMKESTRYPCRNCCVFLFFFYAKGSFQSGFSVCVCVMNIMPLFTHSTGCVPKNVSCRSWRKKEEHLLCVNMSVFNISKHTFACL